MTTKEKLHCAVCGDVVVRKDARDHLVSHNPNAANFSTEEVLAEFKEWPYDPMKCPSCGEPLLKVHFNDYTTYDFDPSTDSYVLDKSAGDADTKCPNCEYNLGNEPQFEEGPANYPANAPRPKEVKNHE